MTVIDPGHVYVLEQLDTGDPVQGPDHRNGASPEWPEESTLLIFVKREGCGYPGNVGHHSGTNIQEVLRVLIDRVQYLDQQIQHRANDLVILHLRACIVSLENRAAERHGRPYPELTDTPELMAVCERCGHIGCNSDKH